MIYEIDFPVAETSPRHTKNPPARLYNAIVTNFLVNKFVTLPSQDLLYKVLWFFFNFYYHIASPRATRRYKNLKSVRNCCVTLFFG